MALNLLMVELFMGLVYSVAAAIGLSLSRLFTRDRSHFRVTNEDKQRAVRYYNGLAQNYDAHVKRGGLGFPRRLERTAVLEAACLDPSVRTVLDVGCGSGFYALEAKRHGAQVCAIDLAPDMVTRIRERIDEAWVADVEKLRLDRTFDRVICAGILDFVSDPEAAFRNLCRLVTPGGRLVLLCPRVGIGGWYYRIEKWYQGFRVNLFRSEWLLAIAEEYDLELVDKRKPLPTNMVLALQRKAAKEEPLAAGWS